MGFLYFIIFSAIILLAQAVSENVRFANFNGGDESLFMLFDANIYNDALQVTEEAAKDPQNMENKSGRAIYKTKYKMWRRSSSSQKMIASFNATFVLNIHPVNGSGAEGLAFFITSKNHGKPANSHGQWLGLFNSSNDGNISNQMVAVEFDTRKSDGTNDTDGNHVGIDVNSINSRNSASLDSHNISLTGGSNITAWVHYDGNDRSIRVYVAAANALASDAAAAAMPSIPVIDDTLDLSEYLDEDAYFGFSASTGNDTELNCILLWDLWIEPVTSDHGSSVPTLEIALSVVAGALFVAGVVIIILFIKYRKSRAEAAAMSEALDKLPGRPREFRYADIKKATRNFSPQFELGRGGFGAVYKANVKTSVAVKRIFKDSKQGKKEFMSEISIITGLRHRNLVPLLGWCHDKGRLMMVYEYMPNGSLDAHIYRGLLDWEQRYNVVSGVASALLYLHEECEQQVIHRDLKASNIMLDSDCNARLGDFGLARLIDQDRTSYTQTVLAGTMGYIAPECFLTQRATVESDVFGFGAVVLEVACGRPPKSAGDAPDLVGWVWNLHRENKIMEAAGSRLFMPEDTAPTSVEDIKCLLMVGLACSNPNPGDRPTMRQVKQILCRDMPPPFVPPFRPPFVWPHPNSESDYTSTFTSTSTSNTTTIENSLLRATKSLLHSPGTPEMERHLRKTFSDIDL